MSKRARARGTGSRVRNPFPSATHAESKGTAPTPPTNPDAPENGKDGPIRPNRDQRRRSAKADQEKSLRQGVAGFIGVPAVGPKSTKKMLADAERLLAVRQRRLGYRGVARPGDPARVAEILREQKGPVT